MGLEPIVLDVTLRQKGRWFIGSFHVPRTARAVFVRVVSRDSIDDRDGNCWSVPVCDPSGVPVIGAFAQLAGASRYGGNFAFSVTPDLAHSRTLAEQERHLYPHFVGGWIERWRTSLAQRSGEPDPQLRSELDSLLRSWSDRQEAISDLIPFLELTGHGVRVAELERAWVQKDPLGAVALRVAWREASDLPNPENRLDRIERILRDFSITPDDDMLQLLVHTAIAAQLWDKADEFIHRMPRKEPMFLNSLVTKLIAANSTIDRASVLAKEAVNAARNYDPARKPALLSLREYRRQRAAELPIALGTYGDALRALGYLTLAEKVYGEAVELTHGKDPDLNRRLQEVKVSVKREH